MNGSLKSPYKAAQSYLGNENASFAEVNRLRGKILTQLNQLVATNAQEYIDELAANQEHVPDLTISITNQIAAELPIGTDSVSTAESCIKG